MSVGMATHLIVQNSQLDTIYLQHLQHMAPYKEGNCYPKVLMCIRNSNNQKLLK